MANTILLVLIGITIKSLTVGSEFSFYLWFKHGKKYTHWYNNRPKFDAKDES